MKKIIVMLLAIALSVLSLTQGVRADAALETKKAEAIQWVETHFGPKSDCHHPETYKEAMAEVQAATTVEEINEILQGLEDFHKACLEAISKGEYTPPTSETTTPTPTPKDEPQPENTGVDIIANNTETTPTEEEPKENTTETTETPKEEPQAEEVTPTPLAPKADAEVSTLPMTLDGKPITVGAYLINESHYFKVRDIAALFTGTTSQFNVSYDEEKKMVVFQKGEAYVPLETDLQPLPEGIAKAEITFVSFLLDGEKVPMNAYLIHENNYIKLRDLGAALNFGVDYEEATMTVVLTSKPSENKPAEEGQTNKGKPEIILFTMST